MPYLTIDTHRPLLVVRRVGVADAASVTSMLAWTGEQIAASDRKLGWIYDAGETPGGLPDAAARKAGADWIAGHQRLLREKCAGLDFAFASPLSRGALTAVFWIAAPKIPWAMHATLRSAVDAAIARLEDRRGLDAAAIVRALGATPST